jgi:hypothetical protein
VGRNRQSTVADTSSATTFGAKPPAISVTVIVSGSKCGWDRSLISASRRSISSRTARIPSTASTPDCGDPEWTFSPYVVIVNRATPFSATATVISVGSPMMAPSASMPDSTRCSEPIPPFSPPTTNARITSPEPSLLTYASAARILAASAPFISDVPRSTSRPVSSRSS